MSKDSRIEWTHHTFNPWWGCTKVSPGCKHCYAETWAKRLGQNVWGAGAPRRELTSAYWKQPATWNAEAARTRTRARVFCASMADVFEDRRDLDARRKKLWGIIDETPHLDWLLLTKRPQNVAHLAPWTDRWPENVWLGATAESQRWLDKRMPALTSLGGRLRFPSCQHLVRASFSCLVSPCWAHWTSRDGSKGRTAESTGGSTGSSAEEKAAITPAPCIRNG